MRRAPPAVEKSPFRNFFSLDFRRNPKNPVAVVRAACTARAPLP